MKYTPVIMFGNNKGGVGKTTTSLNVAAGFSEIGKKCIFVDIDDSSNSTTHLKAKGSREKSFPVTRLLSGSDCSIADCILWNTKLDGVGIIPSDRNIKKTIAELTKGDERKVKMVAERFKEHLEMLDGEVDYIIIDVGPSLDQALAIALHSVTHLVTVADANSYSEEGIINMFRDDMKFVKESNSSLKIIGSLYNNMDTRNGMAKELIGRKEVAGNIPVIPIYIPARTEISENSFTKDFAVRDGKNTLLAESYRELIKFMIEKTEMELKREEVA